MTLLYDAVDEFVQSRSQVLFLNEGRVSGAITSTSEMWRPVVTLYDIDEGAEMPYRREGDLIDTTDCEKEQKDVVTFKELVEETPELVAAMMLASAEVVVSLGRRMNRPRPKSRNCRTPCKFKWPSGLNSSRADSCMHPEQNVSCLAQRLSSLVIS